MTIGLKIHILDIESAINYWRLQPEAVNGVSLCSGLDALAQTYALMVYENAQWVPVENVPEEAVYAWLKWYETTPDAPCIAICSTSQGDDICKGCGRTFDEIQRWTSMTPIEKRMVWQRIFEEGLAYRFTSYKERDSLIK